MFMKNLFIALAIFAVSISFSSKGAKLYKEKLCVTCHGKQGLKPIQSDYPKLARQNMKYLIKQTKLIRDGKRTSGLSETMAQTMGSITNDEIEAISKWLSKAPYKKKKVK